jgi:hypothetical protein
VSTAEAERALYALAYWLKDGDPVRVASVVVGMPASVVAEARDVYQTPGVPEALYELPQAELQRRMLGLAGKSCVPLGLERKSITATDVTVETGSDLGSFSGYLAVYARDSGGDTITPQALQQTVADFQAGRRRWLLTDGHSDQAGDVVAEVDTAELDSIGLRVTAQWLSSDRAQMLRQMVLDGARLGLSIDYTAEARPDGLGGRLLEQVQVYGGAVTPRPMNGLAVILEGKDARGAPGVVAGGVGALADLAQLEQWARAEQAEAGLYKLATASVGQLEHLVAVKATSDAAELGRWADSPEVAAAVRRDPAAEAAERDRAQWQRENAYSADLAGWMREHARA